MNLSRVDENSIHSADFKHLVGVDFQAFEETSQGSRKFSKTTRSVEQLNLCVWVRLQELFVIRKHSIKIVIISVLYHVCAESDIKVRE